MVMEYDPTQDIRDFYRQKIRALDLEIQTRGRRDPTLHTLFAERKLLRSKLASIASTHTAPQGRMAEYGIW